MGNYRVTDPESGTTLTLQGDSPPTEQELTDIFAEHTRRANPGMNVSRTEPPVEQMGVPALFGTAAKFASRAAYGGLADLGAKATGQDWLEHLDAASGLGEPEPTNIKALVAGEDMPAETQIKQLPMPLRIPATAAKGLIETAPQLAAVAGAEALGIPAPLAAAGVFGSTEKGYDWQQGAIAAALPFVGKYSGEITGALARQLKISNVNAVNILKGIGGTAGAAGYLGVIQESEIENLPESERKEARIEALAGLIGQSVLGPMGVEFEPTVSDMLSPEAQRAVRNVIQQAKQRRVPSLVGPDIVPTPDYRPPEPGPLGVIPEGRSLPVRRPRMRINLPAQPTIQPTGEQNAIPVGSAAAANVGQTPGDSGEVGARTGQETESALPQAQEGKAPDETGPPSVTPVVTDEIQLKQENIKRRIAAGIDPHHIFIVVNKDKAVPGFGYVQVDENHPTLGNTFSSNPEQLRSLGMDIPDTKSLMTLPSGRYTLPQAKELLEPKSDTALDPATFPRQDIPVERIKLSKDVPNFKAGADPETGVVQGEQLQGDKYVRLGTAPIVLWQRLNGDLEVITGRHKLDLARRLNEKTVPAQIVREAPGPGEADGWTIQRAARLDAESNIRDGQGSVADYANYFKHSPDLSREAAEAQSLLSRAKGRAGWALGRSATDELYDLYRNDKIGEPQAIAIADAAPNQPNLQRLGIKQALKGKTAPEIASEIEAAKVLTSGVRPSQIDLWGQDDSAIDQMERMAAAARQRQRDIQDDIAAISGASKRPERARKLGVNVDDPAAVKAKLTELIGLRNRWEKWSQSPELVDEVRRDAANQEAREAQAKKKVGGADLNLAAPESVDEQAARLAAEEAARKAAAEKERLAAGAAAPLVGTTGNLGQGDLLTGPQDLFSPPAPKPAIAEGAKPFFTPAEQQRVDQIKAALRAKLGRTNIGIDPEFVTLGSELAYHYIKAGIRKFGAFADQMISDLGDKAKTYLLSWYNNARLQLSDIAHELDDEATAQKTYSERFQPADVSRPDISGGVGGSSGAGRRPGVRVAREELIPQPKQYVGVDSYAARSGFRLDNEQVRGVNLVLDWFQKGIARASFLLADGPGFGKTAQSLAVADMYRKLGMGNRVLIITQNKTIAETRFKGDAAKMGIDMSPLTITTYSGLTKLASHDWDLVIFDESHNLKNGDAQKSMAAARLTAKHELFATATPMDRPTGAAYFLSKITGEDYLTVANKLGYTFQTRQDPITQKVVDVPVLLQGMNWQKVWQNIMAYRDAAVAAGAMIRREYPFFGKVSTDNLSMSRDAKMEQERIARHFDALIEMSRSPTARRNYAGQKTLTLSRWSEQQKIDDAVQKAVEHVKNGGQAIIVAETDKTQKFPQPIKGAEKRLDERGRDAWYVDGAITKMKKMLAAAGITDIADIHDPTSNKIAEEVGRFQSGKARVALATPQSGGTGIDLDDVIGNAPRLMIVLSKNFSGDSFEQLVGRVSRKNTASPAEVKFLNLNDSHADNRRNDVLYTKVKTLKAIQGGEEIDVAGGFEGAKPASVEGKQAQASALAPTAESASPATAGATTPAPPAIREPSVKPPETQSLTVDQQRMVDEAAKASQKYQIAGQGPQTHTLVERLPQTEIEKQAGDPVAVRMRNDKTGKEDTYLESQLTPVRTLTAAERAAARPASMREIDDALLKAGMEPETFPDRASKIAALKRAKAKGIETGLEGPTDESKAQQVGGNVETMAGISFPEQETVARDLGSSGAVLWLTSDEIERLFPVPDRTDIRARQPSQAQSTRATDLRGQLHPGTETEAPSIPTKPRIIIETNPKGEVLSVSRIAGSNFLAHRILFENDKSPAANRKNNFLKLLSEKLPGLTFVFKRLGEGKAHAEYDPKSDTININTDHVGKYDYSKRNTIEAWDAVLGEELIHALTWRVSTAKERGDVWRSLSIIERQKVLGIYERDPGTDEYRGAEYIRMLVQERLFGKTTERFDMRKTPAVLRLLTKALRYLRTVFGDKPPNDIARQVIDRIEGAIRGDAPIRQSVFDGGEEPIRSGIAQAGELTGEQEYRQRRERHRQYMGVQQGPLQEIENIEQQRAAVQQHFFNGDQPVAPTATDDAWHLAQELAHPERKAANVNLVSRMVGDAVGGTADMAPALALNELRNYALRLVAENKDRSLMKFLVDQRLAVIDPGGELDPTQVGRALRGLREAVTPFWQNIVRLTRDRDKAAGKASAVGELLFHQLMDMVERVGIAGTEIDKMVRDAIDGTPGADKPGQGFNKSESEDMTALQREAQAIMEKMEKERGAEWVKPEARLTVRQIIQEFLRGELDRETGQFKKPALTEGNFSRELLSRLTAPGIDIERSIAMRIAKMVYEDQLARWTTRGARAIDRAAAPNEAGQYRHVRQLVEAMLAAPYRAQHDPAWRQRTAADWFMASGLSREQAEVAARTFSANFDAALQQAAERGARELLAGKTSVESIYDIVKAIRLGLTDPNKFWADDIAQRTGFKPLTPEQHQQAAVLDLKFQDPSLSPPEQVAVMEQMHRLWRQAGNHDGAWARALGEIHSANLLVGPRTLILHIFQPPMSLLLRDLPVAIVFQPRDLPMLSRALVEAGKNWVPEFKYAWQNDAYAFTKGRMFRWHEELKRQFELGQEEIKAGKVRGWLRMTYAWGQYVTRFLQASTQAGQSIVNEWKLALYGSSAMRDAGLNTSQIGELAGVIARAKGDAYEEGLMRGLDKNTARVRADYVLNEAVKRFFANEGLDGTAIEQIFRNAENDAHSAVGYHSPLVKGESSKEGTKGWGPERPLYDLMEFVSERIKEGGASAIAARMAFGFFNIPTRIALYGLNYTPYGLFRYGIYRYRMSNRGKFAGKSPWQQSFANEMQARQRLREAVVGTSLMFGALASAWVHSSADDDADKKAFGVYVTGRGPKNRLLRDAWERRGFKPNAIVVVAGGKVIGNIPITRVGGALAAPLGLAASHDDVAWMRKEAAAGGKPVKLGAITETAHALGTYAGIVGAQGAFQGISHFIKLTEGTGPGQGTARVLADAASGTLGAIVVQGKQFWSFFNEMLYGPPDRSSIESVLKSNFPVPGVQVGNRALNRFGDPIYDQSWYGKATRLNLPFAFKLADTSENRNLYGLLLEKGAGPPDLRRSVIEERYRPLTDDEWNKFVVSSGKALKAATVAGEAGLAQMAPEDVKKFLSKQATAADAQAAAVLGLERSKPLKTDRGGAAAPETAGTRLPSDSGTAGAARGGGGSTGALAGTTPVVRGVTSSSGGRRGVIGARPTIRPRLRLAGAVRGKSRLVSGRLSTRGGGRRRIHLPAAGSRSRTRKRIRLGTSHRRLNYA